jgi:GNAT superfamily N-acetyltransferase
MIRPMVPEEEYVARWIYEACHPGWPEKPHGWYFANPTLVYEDRSGIVAHASFAIDPMTNTMYLRDSCVSAPFRGRGIARLLMEERERIGRELGVQRFVGCTWEGNVAIVKIHERLGYHACQRVPGYFKHNSPPADGIIYIKAEG